MQHQEHHTDLPGHLHHFNGSEPILLNDPNTIWVVRSGAVAVFAVTVEAGNVRGARRYLFNLDLGEALFGTSPSLTQQQLLAVPLGQTSLLKLDLAAFREWVMQGEPQVVAWVEGWLQQLNRAWTIANLPAIQHRSCGGQRLSVNPGHTFQPEADTLCWVKIQQGRGLWMGLEDFALDASMGTVPLGDRVWLQAENPVQLTTQTTATLGDPDLLLAGLSQFHIYLLRYLKQLAQQEAEEEQHRLQQQEQLNRRVTSEAMGELAGSLGTQAAPLFPGSNPLLVVAGAVGRAMGIAISPPAASVDLSRVRDPLEAIAHASRIRLRQVLLRGNWWQQECGSLLGYTRHDNRPVALLPVSSSRYVLFDPADQSRTAIDASLADSLNPVAYTFYRSLPDKALNANDLLQFMLQGQFRDLGMIVLLGIVTALLGMLTPHATGILIDKAIPDSDRGLLMQIGFGLLMAAIGGALFRLAQGFALLRVETVSDNATQAAVWDRLLNLPLSFFRRYTTGDLQFRLLAISTIRRQLSGTTLITLLSSLFALLNLALMFWYSWQLSLIAVAFAVLTIVVTVVSGVFLVRKNLPLLELSGSIFGQTVQLINGISKLRIASAEERAFATWSKNYSRQVRLELSTQLIEDIVIVFNTILPTLVLALFFWFTLRLLEDARLAGSIGLTVGTFLSFNSAFGSFSRGVTDLSNTLTNALDVVPQWQRAQPILKATPEVDLSCTDPGKLTGAVTIDHVTFRYRPDGPLTLEDVSLHAAPGEFLAIVGGSGSGKSTLFRLLLGFEAPESGGVYYDGQDLAGLNVEAVRRQMGVVLQAGRIMAGAMIENIACGARITLEEAWEAARMAGLADDIKAMPMQMHTVLSEGGSNLSGGQRQRLLIARALALKPRILLLDEATSALDNRTQEIVTTSLNSMNVTRLVIAHRLSTIRTADRIYVMQSGRVIQQGNFEQLAAQEGVFAQLIARQTT
jgi:ATP-binding cassette subfamily C protein